MMRFPRATGLIGVEVGHSSLRAVQVRWLRAGAAAFSAGLTVPLRTPGTLAEEDAHALASALRRAGFVGSEVAASAPQTSLFSTILELPPRSSAAPIRQLARIEVARIHRREANDFEMGMWDLPAPDRRPGGTHAMAVCLPRASAESLAGAFLSAGLRLVCLDAPMCAIARACAAATPAVPGLLGILEVNWDWCAVTLVHTGSAEGTVPVYERRIEEVSLKALSASMEAKLGLSPAAVRATLRGSPEGLPTDDRARDLLRHARAFQSEFLDRLVPEVQRSFSYAVQQYPNQPMTTLLLTGEGAAMRGLRERLTQSLGLDVRCIAPVDAVAVTEGSAAGNDPAYIPALGLALLRPKDGREALRKADAA